MVIIIHSVWKSCMTLPLFTVSHILLPRKPNLDCGMSILAYWNSISFLHTSYTKMRGEMAPRIQAEAYSEYNVDMFIPSFEKKTIKASNTAALLIILKILTKNLSRCAE